MKSRKGVRFRPKTQATNLNAQEFQTALAFHQNGNLARAKEGYERILKANPGHYGALHLSGLICYEEKQFEDAVTFFLAGIRIAPEFAPLHSSHGVALQELKRFEDAIRSYDAAIAVKADYAEAYYNRGNALQDLQRYDDAIARARIAQAFGRLIRRADDKGVFVMLDPAAPTRLFSSLPEGITLERMGLVEAIEATAAHRTP